MGWGVHMDDQGRRFYTVPELVDILPLGRNTVYRWVQGDDFPKITVGRKIIIPVDALAAYLEHKLGTKIVL